MMVAFIVGGRQGGLPPEPVTASPVQGDGAGQVVNRESGYGVGINH